MLEYDLFEFWRQKMKWISDILFNLMLLLDYKDVFYAFYAYMST